MGWKWFTPEQVSEVRQKLGITEPSSYRWRKEYGGMRIDQAKSGGGH